MMEDDLIGSLTRQVKEEVLENYLAERRLVCLQVEEIEQRARTAKLRAVRVGRRLNRLSYLMVQLDMKRRLLDVLQIHHQPFWEESAEKKLSRRIRIIRVSAITDRRKFRKLVLESYRRLHQHMTIYKKNYSELQNECEAVNRNIRSFQSNYDLLGMLNFLRGLDLMDLERKQFLGGNFTARELASVDQTLYIKPLSLSDYNVPVPLELPAPATIEKALTGFSDEVYRKYEKQVKMLML